MGKFLNALTKSVAGSSNVTLTEAECTNSNLILTGVLTGNINVIVPTTRRVYQVFNATTGAYTLTVKTASGTGVAVTQGASALLQCDGTNVAKAIKSADLPATEFASQAEAEAGTAEDKPLNALRVAQAIAALGVNAYDVSGGCIGAPEADAVIAIFNVVRAFTLPASLADSEATAEVAADAETVFSVKKNGSEIGTITFAAAGTTGTFAGAGASFAAGDKLTVVAPASPDATLADIAFTLKGAMG